jgi:hypothetical protein
LSRREGKFKYSMPKTKLPNIKLGTYKFHADSEEIDALDCGVTSADCAELGARMIAGEFEGLKKINLVSFFLLLILSFVFRNIFVLLKCVGADVCGAESKPNWRCGSKIHRGSAESQYERADSGSCEFCFYSRFEILLQEHFCLFEMRGY